MKSAGDSLDLPSRDGRCLYLIDDAHLIDASILVRIEEKATPDCLVVTTHNAEKHSEQRGAIAIDTKLAVRTIAKSLRVDLESTLAAVRLADDRLGERMTDEDIEDRLDDAEDKSSLPWQFCFVLGGGWRRSKQAADNSRIAGADQILAAVAMRQILSRDASATIEEIERVCAVADIDASSVQQGLSWLVSQRLVVSSQDVRTPHQRFALVVLLRILQAQEGKGRETIASMMADLMASSTIPLQGIRNLVHELRFDSYSWSNLLEPSVVDDLVKKCWSVEGDDRNAAGRLLVDLFDFSQHGIDDVVQRYLSTMIEWINHPTRGAYGIGDLLNHVRYVDADFAKKVLYEVDPIALANAYSGATPDTAYGLANVISSVGAIGEKKFNQSLGNALDRSELLKFASNEVFFEKGHVFSKFCSSVLWLDESLALDMAEKFIPAAQHIIKNDAVEGFQQICHDYASTTLRMYDPLGVYRNKFKPSKRRRLIATRVCETLDPKKAAADVLGISPRYFQAACSFLSFLRRSAPAKHDQLLSHLSIDELEILIGEDWANMPHDTEIFLSSLYKHNSPSDLVVNLIGQCADQIKMFPPRLLLMAPDVGLSHVESGGVLRLVHYGHVSFSMGGLALAIIADTRPDLIEAVVAKFIDEIAESLTSFNRNFTGPADGFITVLIKFAPLAWAEILSKFNLDDVEENLAECLRGKSNHRRAAAFIVESALDHEDEFGDIAKRLRARFPAASISPSDEPRFTR